MSQITPPTHMPEPDVPAVGVAEAAEITLIEVYEQHTEQWVAKIDQKLADTPKAAGFAKSVVALADRTARRKAAQAGDALSRGMESLVDLIPEPAPLTPAQRADRAEARVEALDRSLELDEAEFAEFEALKAEALAARGPALIEIFDKVIGPILSGLAASAGGPVAMAGVAVVRAAVAQSVDPNPGA